MIHLKVNQRQLIIELALIINYILIKNLWQRKDRNVFVLKILKRNVAHFVENRELLLKEK